MHSKLTHHFAIVGGRPELLSEDAVTAIHQSSGGPLRRANALAKGALLAAASESSPRATAEHVRLASTEIF
jgi:type II secretory pathway predicted ATPase ExeA